MLDLHDAGVPPARIDNYREIYEKIVEDKRILKFDGGYVYIGDHKSIFLNGSARIILELCDGERCVAAIANEIKGIFSLPFAPLDDTEQCIKSLHSSGLVFRCATSEI